MAEEESVATPSPGAEARRLMRAADRAALATSLARAGRESWPYASLVMAATAADLSPLLLLSDLADHARNIARDGRVSLLFDGTGGLAEPLTGPRFTLLGRARESAAEADRGRYLRRHPGAGTYFQFKDFRLYRVTPESGHLVAGFGRIHWLEAADFLPAGKAEAALAEHEAEILAHMNEDHGDAVALYARKLLGLEGEGWRMTGIDPEGIDLRAGGRTARLAFERPLGGPGEARPALVALARRAREAG